jgi:hypothetical protein
VIITSKILTHSLLTIVISVIHYRFYCILLSNCRRCCWCLSRSRETFIWITLVWKLWITFIHRCRGYCLLFLLLATTLTQGHLVRLIMSSLRACQIKLFFLRLLWNHNMMLSLFLVVQVYDQTVIWDGELTFCGCYSSTRYCWYHLQGWTLSLRVFCLTSCSQFAFIWTARACVFRDCHTLLGSSFFWIHDFISSLLNPLLLKLYLEFRFLYSC